MLNIKFKKCPDYIFSVAGDVKFWDLRHTNSIKSIPPTNAMTAMAIHSSLDLIAW